MITARAVSLFQIDDYGLRTPVLRPLPLEIDVTLRKRACDGATLETHARLRFPESSYCTMSERASGTRISTSCACAMKPFCSRRRQG